MNAGDDSWEWPGPYSGGPAWPPCEWCGRTYTPTLKGGPTQRFCKAACGKSYSKRAAQERKRASAFTDETPEPTGSVAPWCSHPEFEAAVLAAAAPQWDPSDAVKAFLGLPDDSVQELVAWIAAEHRRSLCRCGEPIQWTTKRRISCSGRCRAIRARRKASATKAWLAEREFLRGLGLDPDIEEEGQLRHEARRQLLDGSYPHPRRKRRGSAVSAQPHFKERKETTGTTVFSHVDALRQHEDLVLLDEGKDRRTTAWLREHGYNKHGEPL